MGAAADSCNEKINYGADEHQQVMALDEAVAMIAGEAVPPDLRIDAEKSP